VRHETLENRVARLERESDLARPAGLAELSPVDRDLYGLKRLVDSVAAYLRSFESSPPLVQALNALEEARTYGYLAIRK
jgi:hypothetical protein